MHDRLGALTYAGSITQWGHELPQDVRFGRRTPLRHADALRSRNAHGAIPRDDFLACDP